MNTREIAKAYSVALKVNAIVLPEIIEWADSVIVATNEPDILFIELSLSKKESEAQTHLHNIAIGAKDKLFQSYLFGIFYKGLINKRSSYEDVSKLLYFLAMEDDDLEIYNEAMHYWDAIDLADHGCLGDPVEVRKEFLKVLKENMLEITIPNKTK